MVKTNCPNCGAPISTDKCPFCGTSFIDLSCMNADEPFWLKVRHKGKVLTVKVLMRGLSITNLRPEVMDLYDCVTDRMRFIVDNEPPTLEMKFSVIPDKNIVYRHEPDKGGDAT